MIILLSLLVSYSLANSLNPCMPPIGSHRDFNADMMVSDCTPDSQAQYQQHQNQQSLTPTQQCQSRFWINARSNDGINCTCKDGYTRSSDGKSCVLGPCAANASRNNDWVCSCNEWYISDWSRWCVSVQDICSSNNQGNCIPMENTCSDPNAHSLTDWTCRCNDGYGVYKTWGSCITKTKYCQQTYWDTSYASWNSCIQSQVKSYSPELQSAYKYAYSRGITTQSSIQTADMNGSLTRSNMAKMMTNYAKEVLGKTANTSLECNFTDIGNQTNELQGYIKEVCQLWLMGQGLTKFDPNWIVTRAEFGTVLSRSLYGNEYDWGKPYYINHLQALKNDWVMSDISKPNSSEIRWFVMLMLQRASNLTNISTSNNSTNWPVDCSTPNNQLNCSLGLNTCPKECLWNTSKPDCSKTNSIMGGCLQQ